MLSEIVKFWDSLGWLANLIEITGAVSAVSGLLYVLYIKSHKIYSGNRKFNKFKNVSGYVESRLEHSEQVLKVIKRKFWIAIVDDNPSDLQDDYLRRAGFKVDVYKELSLADSDKLLPYAVILLDIAGVVPEDKISGGLSLIKRLKAQKNHPSIIAVSGKKFDPTLTEFFKLADDVMKKPISEEECESHVIDLLEQKFSPVKAAENLDSYIGKLDLSVDKYAKIIKLIILWLEKGIRDEDFRAKITRKYDVSDWPKVKGLLDRIMMWFNGEFHDNAR